MSNFQYSFVYFLFFSNNNKKEKNKKKLTNLFVFFNWKKLIYIIYKIIKNNIFSFLIGNVVFIYFIDIYIWEIQ